MTSEIRNPVIEAIVARAEGLPLYVRNVLEDLRSGHFHCSDLPRKLPPGLSGYYDDLLRRMSIGDLQAVLTPLVVTLAWARAPLGEEILQLLLERRKVLTKGEPGRRLLRLGIATVQSMLRREKTGWQLYHPRFQEHIQRDEAGRLREQNKLARQEFVELAKDWRDLDRNGEACLYALRHGPQHLADEGEAPALRALLLDYRFLEAKVEAGWVEELIGDYEALPNEREILLIQGALRLSSHVIRRDSRQFASQMVGRLLPHEETSAIKSLMDETAKGAPRPWLRPLHPALTPPGGPLILTLEGHTDTVSDVAITPDGRLAISASWDWSLKLWELASGQELKTLEGHDGSVHAVALTPDGKWAVSASRDQTLKVWDLASGTELKTLEGLDGSVDVVAVTPDGKCAVSASGGTLKVWDMESGSELKSIEAHPYGINDLAVIPSGRSVVSASEDNTLKMWDLMSGSELKTLKGHLAGVWGVAVTPDGRRAVSASGDRTLRVWNLESGKKLRILKSHLSDVHGVAVTPDGRRAVSASGDNTLKVWDLESGRVLETFEGHSGYVTAVAVTSDGRRAVSASGDNTLKVWELESGRKLKTPEGHSSEVTRIAVTPDGRLVVSGSRDNTLKLWDPESGRELKVLKGHSSSVQGAAITSDGQRAISVSLDGTLRVWELASGLELRVLKGLSELDFESFEGLLGLVKDVAVTPDGRYAIVASDDKRAAAAWNETKHYEESTDKTLRVWDLESGTELRALYGHSSGVNGIAVTADGRSAVSASSDDTLKVWDVASGRELKTLKGHSDSVAGVAITFDGRRVISASWDTTLKVWDMESGSALKTLVGHSEGVGSVEVGSDGRCAVSASMDKTVRVWDLLKGMEVAAFTCDAPARCCAFIDATRIVAGDVMGRLYWLELVE